MTRYWPVLLRCLAYHFVSLWLASIIFKMQLGRIPLDSRWREWYIRTRWLMLMLSFPLQWFLEGFLVELATSVPFFSFDKIAVITLHLQLHGVILTLNLQGSPSNQSELFLLRKTVHFPLPSKQLNRYEKKKKKGSFELCHQSYLWYLSAE